MVTTRKTTVARVMNCTQPYDLGLLSDEDALSLLAISSIDEHNFDKHPSLISAAQSFIEKCDRLPLALIAIGRVLKSRKTDVDEWAKLLDSVIWSSPYEKDILLALKLSYYDLPLHLKQLFAHCCLFPKDYVFNKNGLVLLWMAEGFLNQTTTNMSMERLGGEYFQELYSRSFFQHSTGNEFEYTMHDLMNDLAISVVGDFFFTLNDKMDVNGRNEAFEKFRHFSVLGQRGARYINRNLEELYRCGYLRTFLAAVTNKSVVIVWDKVLEKLLPQLQFLRVLSLTRRSIMYVPISIGRFKHLRYLNFSKTDIEHVPEVVSDLYNLQSLLVSECYKLVRLPLSFAKLINLRHLDMSNTPKLMKTPLGIGRLTSLQTLSKVFIEEDDNGFNVSDLKSLLNLESQLSISGLDKVTDPQQAFDANLQGKKGLTNLDMNWSSVFDDSRDPKIEDGVFERLRVPNKLNKLNILNYGGTKFPSWFADPLFDRLKKLCLKGCMNCTDFQTNSFPILEYLETTDMLVLEKWSNHDGDKTTVSFPRLREIRIKDCPKLGEVSTGLIKSLEVLVLKIGIVWY
ncbi:putative disease resistance RPP13-like protein 1 [Rutidosis leptorrhynchoides]|uniref:putative disease resistance RPP13-like protein 1 n=1 Tax=Rutidosis leptorrhynchoides TaxID=125765 RepID=UPI003A99907E